MSPAGGFNMDDYVPVNDRIAAFKETFPEGCLQSEITHLTEGLVVVKAYAFRTPDDRTPGVGHSSLEIPGKTTFTRGSEIENAETSAWGRALAALGFEVKKGVASREEVRGKQAEPPRSRQKAEPEPARAGGHLLKEALEYGAQRMCDKHPEIALVQSKSGKWGHVLPDGGACVLEAAVV